MLHVQFSGLRREFEARKGSLVKAAKFFEAEQEYAKIEIQAQRHAELKAMLEAISPRVDRVPVTNVQSAPNNFFTGRQYILGRLHAKLKPSFAPEHVRLRSRRSCVVHGLAGMGKTETVLEYTYRHGSCYTHVFWVHAEKNATMFSSFLEIHEKLRLESKQSDDPRKVKATRDWFSTTGKSDAQSLD